MTVQARVEILAMIARETATQLLGLADQVLERDQADKLRATVGIIR